jgi:hypothetical protein
MTQGWVTTDRIGDTSVLVPVEAVTDGPSVTWKHIDGPLLRWAGSMHWLTFRERLRIFLRLATVDEVACERWPHLARLREKHTRKASWHGKHLTEDEIVADMLAKIKADPEGLKRWTDLRSWKIPLVKGGFVDPEAPEHAGCLAFAGMQVRNYYGLWHRDCPITKANGPDMEITDGIITDPRHPDNLSGRIIERVRTVLTVETEELKP